MADRIVRNSRRTQAEEMLRVKIRRQEFAGHLARKHFTQKHLADELDISISYLSQLLRGTRQPGPRVRKRIEEVLDVGFDEVFELDGADQAQSGPHQPPAGESRDPLLEDCCAHALSAPSNAALTENDRGV